MSIYDTANESLSAKIPDRPRPESTATSTLDHEASAQKNFNTDSALGRIDFQLDNLRKCVNRVAYEAGRNCNIA